MTSALILSLSSGNAGSGSFSRAGQLGAIPAEPSSVMDCSCPTFSNQTPGAVSCHPFSWAGRIAQTEISIVERKINFFMGIRINPLKLKIPLNPGNRGIESIAVIV